MQSINRSSCQKTPSSQQPSPPKPTQQELLDALMNRVCPPRLKRNLEDPEQNAQFWNYSDYSSQGSAPKVSGKEEQRDLSVQCSQPKGEFSDASIPASPTPERSCAPSPRSHVSGTPGVAESSPPAKMFSAPGRTGQPEMSAMYGKYEELYRKTKLLEERFKMELGPKLFQCQLDFAEAVETFQEEEKSLNVEIRARTQDTQGRMEALQIRFNREVDALRSEFLDRLRNLQTRFNRQIDNLSPTFRLIKQDIENLQQDWVRMYSSMDELYRSVAEDEALEARLMEKHLALRMPQVGLKVKNLLDYFRRV